MKLTRSDVSEQLKRLVEAIPSAKMPTAGSINDIFKQLSEARIDVETLSEAVDHLQATRAFFPSHSEIRSMCLSLKPNIGSPGESYRCLTDEEVAAAYEEAGNLRMAESIRRDLRAKAEFAERCKDWTVEETRAFIRQSMGVMAGKVLPEALQDTRSGL